MLNAKSLSYKKYLMCTSNAKGFRENYSNRDFCVEGIEISRDKQFLLLSKLYIDYTLGLGKNNKIVNLIKIKRHA